MKSDAVQPGDRVDFAGFEWSVTRVVNNTVYGVREGALTVDKQPEHALFQQTYGGAPFDTEVREPWQKNASS